ncbi:3935_t:CDS:2 [Paraglomus brasilianum]|uniref:3935_t:CDS:1 n=1 Tax=Paraglomus brasilianum TaxID=144538 RepID=A0A9N9DPU2_9GLOM|nr:3935_t:CDS:2 [Paraglomus brasilianum]
MAEAVFAHVLQKNELEDRFYLNSAGTQCYNPGHPPNPRTVEICRRHGIPVSHYSRNVAERDYYEFDYMLCMDSSHLLGLNQLKPEGSKAKIMLFGEFDPQGDRNIVDPYFGDLDEYERVYQQVSRCTEAFLKHLSSA